MPPRMRCSDWSQSIEELALLSDSPRNDAVRLGVLRAKLNAMATRFDLMQTMGLPLDLDAVCERRGIAAIGKPLQTCLSHQLPEAV